MGKKDVGDEENRVQLILKHAVENTNEAFVTIDEDHKVILFNKAAETIFGYDRQEVVGYDLNVIMSPRCSQNHHEAVARYIKTRIPTRIGHETEMVATRKNGETFPAFISFSVTEVNGRLYFTGIVRDLTETKTLQEKIMQSERLASLGQLVAEITHEIKNPLMLIGGFAKQLTRTIVDEKDIRKLNIITDEVNRLEKLLADLRDFHHPATCASEKVDLEKLLSETLSMLRKVCKKKNVQTVLRIDRNARLVVGDRNKLKQVLLNLFQNSIEAMEHGGTLSITTRPSDGSVEMVLTDEGCGIPEGDKEKIFSPFYTTKSYGTGLGLSISKRIIEEHGGSSLSVKSKEGRGTAFKITLPAYGRNPINERNK
jgi:two-component system sensor kinase FixL